MHNFDEILEVIGRDSSSGNPNYVRLTLEGVRREYFYRAGDEWVNTNGANILIMSDEGWVHRDALSGDVVSFDVSGLAKKRVLRNGWEYVYSYTQQPVMLSSVKNAFGRVLHFDYSGLPESISVKMNDEVLVSYIGAHSLYGVKYPDGSGENYEYNQDALVFVKDSLGNVIDEFRYDDGGRVIYSGKPQGASVYQISYADGLVSVKNPLGGVNVSSFFMNKGQAVLSGLSYPSVFGDIVRKRKINAEGLVQDEEDFKGNLSVFSWDSVRRLPVQEVKAANHPGQSQTTRTDWHPRFRLPLRITETGAQGGTRVTQYTYDERGNRLSEAISGDGLTEPRTRSWTYTAQNLVATETDEAGGITRHSYDQWGNRTATTDPLGRTTTYSHDAAGRLLTQTDPSGLVTTHTYDARGRLLTQTAGGLSTVMTYLPNGQLASITQPGGHRIDYQYDAAGRLTGWRDNRGNAGQYVLDGMGNRTHEHITDAQGRTALELSRTINAINRVDSQTVGGNQRTTYQYDANGDLIGHANALNQNTRYILDALRRPSAERDPLNATATLDYNSLNAVVQARDFKGVTTRYERDAQGNALSETSADIGSQSNQYDARGLPASTQDAQQRQQHITRDALGRPTHISASGEGASASSSFSYDSHDSIGQIHEPNLHTGYQRDNLGRPTRKSQQIGPTP